MTEDVPVTVTEEILDEEHFDDLIEYIEEEEHEEAEGVTNGQVKIQDKVVVLGNEVIISNDTKDDSWNTTDDEESVPKKKKKFTVAITPRQLTRKSKFRK